MGGSSWSKDFYNDRVTERAAKKESTFAYSDAVRSKPRAEQKCHPKLDPKGVTREARDSAAHPASVPIGFLLDVTGSMSTVPVQIQKELPRLMAFLIDQGFVTDPQILFGGVGDVHSDKAPLQVGQFESGIEMEGDLTSLWLEGGGGGGEPQESYELGMYFFARHTSTDCYEKRGKKGYLFITGDERPYPSISKEIALRVFGDVLQEAVSLADIVREVKAKYEVFFLIPNGTSHYSDPVLRETWVKLLGDNRVLMIDRPAAIVEVVAAALAVGEGKTITDAIETMQVSGTSKANLNTVAAAFDTTATREGVVRLLAAPILT